MTTHTDACQLIERADEPTGDAMRWTKEDET